MNILITGSQGTLGVPLRAELEARGHIVTGCDLKHSADPNEYRCDITELRQLQFVFGAARPDIVYHLAAEFGRLNGVDFYEQMWKTNCIGTKNVIYSCIGNNAKLIFASSSEAYGSIGDEVDLLEENLLKHKVPSFYNEYALSKWTNEQQITIGRKQGLQAVILRFFNVYGPGEYYNLYRSVICQFIHNLIKNEPLVVWKNGRRSFLYVDDWARTVANAGERFMAHPLALDGGIFNIGSDYVVSMDALLVMLRSLLPKSTSTISIRDMEVGNVQVKRPSLIRAIDSLAHEERTKLSYGLEKTIEWMHMVYG